MIFQILPSTSWQNSPFLYIFPSIWLFKCSLEVVIFPFIFLAISYTIGVLIFILVIYCFQDSILLLFLNSALCICTGLLIVLLHSILNQGFCFVCEVAEDLGIASVAICISRFVNDFIVFGSLSISFLIREEQRFLNLHQFALCICN